MNHNSTPVAVPTRAKIALFTACLFWAASFIATKTALETVPPITVVTLRMIVSALCFLVWFLAAGRIIKYGGLRWLGRLFILSLFGTGLHYGIQTIGLKYTTASNASLYAVTGPITITIIAALFLGEKVTRKKLLGIGLAILGVMIVMGIDTLTSFELKGNMLGDLLVLTSIAMWGVFAVLSKDMTTKIGAVDLTAMVTFMGAIYMIPLGLMEMGTENFSITTIRLEAWLAIAFLGVTCSFLATLLYVYGLQETEAQKAAVYLYTIPPMTYVIAAFYLGETMKLQLLLGSVIVFLGVYLTERG